RLGGWKGTSRDGTQCLPFRATSSTMDRGAACPVSRCIDSRSAGPRRRAKLYRLPQQSWRTDRPPFGNAWGWLQNLRADSGGDESGRRHQPVHGFFASLESDDRLRRSARVVPEYASAIVTGWCARRSIVLPHRLITDYGASMPIGNPTSRGNGRTSSSFSDLLGDDI